MRQKTGRKLLSVLLALAMVVGLMPGMSLMALADGTGAYNDYLVTTDANKAKSGNDLTALRVTFNGMPWYIIEDNSKSATAGTVTLLGADYRFGSKMFDSNYKNNYSTSTLKSALDAYTTSGSFKGVAEATVNKTDNGTDIGIILHCSLLIP